MSKNNTLVMVETVVQYRMRYCVGTPKEHPEWALDTVVMEEAKEFSQKFVGETIMSHRVVSEEEALKMFREDNDYLASWDDEHIKKQYFTRYDGIEHSDYYYDTDRNK